MLFSSSWALVRSIIKKRTDIEVSKKAQNEEHFGKLSLILISLFAYALFFEKLGYLITTSLILIVLFWSTGCRRWTFVFASSVLIALLTYFGLPSRRQISDGYP